MDDDDLQSPKDLERGQLSPREEDNLSAFFQEVEAIKKAMTEISNLLLDLQNLNQEAKSAHSAKLLRGIRDRMDSDIMSVLQVAKIVKLRLESLDKSNAAKRKMSVAFKEGSAVDRTRCVVTNGLRIKLREIMNDFQALREKIMLDYKEYLKRKYYNTTGEAPSEEVIEKMVSGSGNVQMFAGKTEVYMENKERHEAALDIQRSLNRLHQVFLDMAVLVEAQGEKIDDIEHNVAIGGSYIGGGTNSLFYAKQMKKKNNKWVYCVWILVAIILLVCIIFAVSS
ncbi:syntaxin-112-like [Apium graveolens]|uniref:syntaxin-112-like n=1 Tax=Apium graveolens TaxID=4045 RepID=UPI003D7A2BED